MDTLDKLLTDRFPGLKKDFSLKNKTTFKVGGNCRYFLELSSPEDIVDVFRLKDKHHFELYILGKGSNLIIKDGTLDGVVLQYVSKTTPPNEPSEGLIEFNADILLSKAVNICLDRSLKGFEFVTGIPGTVGGAVKMNAGTCDGTISNIFRSAKIADQNGIRDLNKEQMAFSYRNSAIQPDQIVLSAVFKLEKVDSTVLKKQKELINEYLDRRNTNHPVNMPTFGSTFKNPPDSSAGKLIEEAGLKGKRIGDIQVSEKHANFLTNLGNGKAEDAIKLMDLICTTVKEKFDITLEREVRIWGS